MRPIACNIAIFVAGRHPSKQGLKHSDVDHKDSINDLIVAGRHPSKQGLKPGIPFDFSVRPSESQGGIHQNKD